MMNTRRPDHDHDDHDSTLVMTQLVTWRKAGQGCADIEVHDRLQVLPVLVLLVLHLLLLHDGHAQEAEQLPEAGPGGVEPAGVQAGHQLLHLHRTTSVWWRVCSLPLPPPH